MANYAVWNMRQKHEWLQSPLKSKRVKRRTRVRVGRQDAMDRKREAEERRSGQEQYEE